MGTTVRSRAWEGGNISLYRSRPGHAANADVWSEAEERTVILVKKVVIIGFFDVAAGTSLGCLSPVVRTSVGFFSFAVPMAPFWNGYIGASPLTGIFEQCHKQTATGLKDR